MVRFDLSMFSANSVPCFFQPETEEKSRETIRNAITKVGIIASKSSLQNHRRTHEERCCTYICTREDFVLVQENSK